MAGSEVSRREQILQTAASLFASAGFRTTLQEIADACGILPGSLYHHFDSKEALILELVRRYATDLRAIARQVRSSPEDGDPVEAILVLGEAIAACGVRHRGALLLTVYEPPTVLGDELTKVGAQAFDAIVEAMGRLTARASARGLLRRAVDPQLLADRLCRSMLHVGVGVSHLRADGEDIARIRLRIPLFGVARRAPSSAALDRSEAVRAVGKVVASWDESRGLADRRATLAAVARAEFGRRGYEATTMRDIAKAAGVTTGTLYRSFASKDELLASIMTAFLERGAEIWQAAFGAGDSAISIIDALMWGHINLIGRHPEEFRIQLSWLRRDPPSSPDLGGSFGASLAQLSTVVEDGIAEGALHLDAASADLRARCLYEAIVFPPSTIAAAGLRGARAFARDTVLRGAITARRR